MNLRVPSIPLGVLTLATLFATAAAEAQPAEAPPVPPATAAVPELDPDDPLSAMARLPPDVRQKLSGADIVQIVRPAHEARDEKIVVPTVFFATIVCIVLAFVILRSMRDRRLHETLRAMIDKGVDIPPALLVPPAAKKNDRRTGVILATAGVGVAGFLSVVDKSGSGAWALGFVPFLLGVGYLVAHVLDQKSDRA
jgi:hypothetical protein